MSEKKDVEIRRSERSSGRERGLMRPLEDIERWYETFFPRGWLSMPPLGRANALFSPRMPAVDVIDHKDEVIVRAEVPGVRKEDLKVSLSDGTLTIEGRTSHEEEEKRTDYYYHEMTYGDFKRTIDLPPDIEAAKASAKMKDGVLEIQLPKVEKAKRQEVNLEIR